MIPYSAGKARSNVRTNNGRPSRSSGLNSSVRLENLFQKSFYAPPPSDGGVNTTSTHIASIISPFGCAQNINEGATSYDVANDGLLTKEKDQVCLCVLSLLMQWSVLTSLLGRNNILLLPFFIGGIQDDPR